MDKKIIQEHLPLIKSIASKYSSHKIPLEDLIQEGTIGLWKAWQKYDRTKEVKFSTYAVYWIKKHILEAVNKEHKTTIGKVLYDESISNKPKEKQALLKAKQSVNFPDSFPELEKRIIKMLYGLGDEGSYDLAEIGTLLNLRRERVRQIKEKALRRLRNIGIDLK